MKDLILIFGFCWMIYLFSLLIKSIKADRKTVKSRMLQENANINVLSTVDRNKERNFSKSNFQI